jgi:hypothetical protein
MAFAVRYGHYDPCMARQKLPTIHDGYRILHTIVLSNPSIRHIFHNRSICGEVIVLLVEDTGLPNFLTGLEGCTVQFGTLLKLVDVSYNETYTRVKKVTLPVGACCCKTQS